ncbi:hypothetical protein NCCP1664_00370 [Zafaria cholistanensis]|uniref:Uncharacterized protein n=1 Tax=Zafaria cholistanensis TaxID=1682741 RepID=A0A5A7NL86_9MICC|nr:hypothetical protein NCCP1664_00370 [Zafaria cholistanensis]
MPGAKRPWSEIPESVPRLPFPDSSHPLWTPRAASRIGQGADTPWSAAPASNLVPFSHPGPATGAAPGVAARRTDSIPHPGKRGKTQRQARKGTHGQGQQAPDKKEVPALDWGRDFEG